MYLDLTPEDAAKRSEYGAEIFETVEFQRRVYDTYKTLVQRYNWTVSQLATNNLPYTQTLCRSLPPIKVHRILRTNCSRKSLLSYPLTAGA